MMPECLPQIHFIFECSNSLGLPPPMLDLDYKLTVQFSLSHIFQIPTFVDNSCLPASVNSDTIEKYREKDEEDEAPETTLSVL